MKASFRWGFQSAFNQLRYIFADDTKLANLRFLGRPKQLSFWLYVWLKYTYAIILMALFGFYN